MEYDVYRHKNASDEDFDKIDQFFKRVLGEDKWLCNHTQASMNAGVYVNGRMHSEYESGPLYFQSLVKKTIVEHRQQEQKLGKKIWPSMQRVSGEKIAQEMEFCAGLACDSEKSATLNW